MGQQQQKEEELRLVRRFKEEVVSEAGGAKRLFSEAVKSASSSSGVGRLLSTWAQSGSTSLGMYSKLTKLATYPNSLAPQFKTHKADVLPLSLDAVKDAIPELIACCLPDFADGGDDAVQVEELTDLATGCVAALNFLYGAGWSKTSVQEKARPVLSSMQSLMLCNL